MLTIATSLRDFALCHSGLESTGTHICPLRGCARRRDIKGEDVHGKAKSCTCAVKWSNVCLGGEISIVKKEGEEERKEKGRGKRDVLGNIDNTCYVTLDWRTGEKQVDLVVRIAKTTEVFDASCKKGQY